MPVATVGLDKTLKALREFSPDLYKEMNKEIRVVLKQTVNDAKGEIPMAIAGLSSWQKPSVRVTEKRQFPRFQPALARKGIGSSVGKQKKNPKGWAGRYVVFNANPAGMVLEYAGRVHPGGDNTKRNSAHFINAIANRLELYRIDDGKKGRVIYKAVAKNQNKLKNQILVSIESAVNAANKRINNGY